MKKEKTPHKQSLDLENGLENKYEKLKWIIPIIVSIPTSVITALIAKFLLFM